jgi:methylthioribose-1-phosphate isomerase
MTLLTVEPVVMDSCTAAAIAIVAFGTVLSAVEDERFSKALLLKIVQVTIDGCLVKRK